MSQEKQNIETQNTAAFNELEMRLQKLEALVKGLTDEVLDVKAVMWNLQKENRTAPVIREIPIQDENRPSPTRPIITATPIVSDTPDLSKDSHSAQTETDKIEKKEDVLKMQLDGTVRPVEESGEEIIIASALDSRKKESDKKRGMHAIIVADE
jgi:hypothetical protein